MKFLIYFWYEGNPDKASRKLTLRGAPLEIKTEPFKYAGHVVKPGTGQRVGHHYVERQWQDAELWDSAHYIEMEWADLPDFITENGAVIVRPASNMPSGFNWLLMISDHTNTFTQR